MAKLYGEIGYMKTEETKPGVWKKVITEKKYSGDLNRYTRKWTNGQKVNGDITITSEVSIIADPFLIDNLHTIRYVKVYGQPWEIDTIDIQHPRLVLTLGGVYNGETDGDE